MTPPSRPKRYPPPEFPARRSKLFAKTPPAIFPPILGVLGLALALRMALARLGWDQGLADLVAGVAVALWAFGAVAYLAKAARRPGVVLEDLRVLPGRAGLAAMTMGGMASATLLSVYVEPVAMGLLVASLAGHAVLAALLVWLLVNLPPDARAVNPTQHLSFVGFIVAAPAALAQGWVGLAEVLFWGTLPVALGIWGLSLRQFAVAVPPAPLRPLLAIHVAPAALFSTVAGLLAKPELGFLFAALGLAFAVVLAVSLRWMIEAGVTAMWGAFTFPLAALATALMVSSGVWLWPGLAVTALGVGVVPWVTWWVLKRWPGGRLAAVTNAAEA